VAKFHESLITLAVQGLKEIAGEFEDEIGRRPSSAELFEIITWALKSGAGDKLSDVHPANLIALKPQVKKGAGKVSSSTTETDETKSVVKDLNDASFVVAGDLVAALMDGIEKATGKPPSLNELCMLLVEALHHSDDDLLLNSSREDIMNVKPEVKKKGKIVAEIGDVVAIPEEDGGYFIAVILAKNKKYGVAYGFFDGTSKLPQSVSAESHPKVKPHPIYSSDEFIASGRWKIIGHDDDLRALFPAEPEIYYRKQVIPGAEKHGEKIGPYGSARTPSGATRDLTKEEAEELGLLNNTYRQFYLPELLEKYLNAQLK